MVPCVITPANTHLAGLHALGPTCELTGLPSTVAQVGQVLSNTENQLQSQNREIMHERLESHLVASPLNLKTSEA